MCADARDAHAQRIMANGGIVTRLAGFICREVGITECYELVDMFSEWLLMAQHSHWISLMYM